MGRVRIWKRGLLTLCSFRTKNYTKSGHAGGDRLINKDTEVSFFSGGKNKRKLIDPPSLPFLAVQNSSIGERVPHSVTEWLFLYLSPPLLYHRELRRITSHNSQFTLKLFPFRSTTTNRSATTNSLKCSRHRATKVAPNHDNLVNATQGNSG